MFRLYAVLLLLVIPAGAVNAFTYKWTDRGGVIHFTDSPETIPLQYRNRVVKEDDITVRDPKIREEVIRDKERSHEEESIPQQMITAEPSGGPAFQPPAAESSAPETTPQAIPAVPVWNLCAPGQPLSAPCAPGPLKKK